LPHTEGKWHSKQKHTYIILFKRISSRTLSQTFLPGIFLSRTSLHGKGEEKGKNEERAGRTHFSPEPQRAEDEPAKHKQANIHQHGKSSRIANST
jgi:hypothetical protein